MKKDNTGGTKVRKPISKGLIVLICVVLILATGAGAYGYTKYRENLRHMEAVVNVDVFYDGITVNGVALGGMSRDEAKQAVEAQIAEALDVPGIIIVYEDRRWDFTKYDLIGTHNLDAVLDKAWAMGRDGTLRDRYRQVVDIQENGREYSVDVTFIGEAIADELAAIAQEVDRAPADAEIHFDPDGESMFTFTDEVIGRKTDVEGTLAMVRKKIADGVWGEVELMVNEITPKVLRADLEPLTTSIVDFSTSIKGNTQNRAHNVRHALSFIDGFVLMPGETFSFNEVVGKRTAANGFREAPIINSDKALVPGLGGGVCQASTTVYNAALRAGLEIVERFPHSFPVAYIPKGLDATVSWGTQDLKFVNNRTTPVFFHTYYENNNVHVQIFGMPFPNGGEIRCWSEVTSSIAPPPTVVRADHSGKYVKAPGQFVQYVESRTGYKVTAYQGYYENGELVNKTVLHQDYYRSIQGVILAYPGHTQMTGEEVISPLT